MLRLRERQRERVRDREREGGRESVCKHVVVAQFKKVTKFGGYL